MKQFKRRESKRGREKRLNKWEKSVTRQSLYKMYCLQSVQTCLHIPHPNLESSYIYTAITVLWPFSCMNVESRFRIIKNLNYITYSSNYLFHFYLKSSQYHFQAWKYITVPFRLVLFIYQANNYPNPTIKVGKQQTYVHRRKVFLHQSMHHNLSSFVLFPDPAITFLMASKTSNVLNKRKL